MVEGILFVWCEGKKVDVACGCWGGERHCNIVDGSDGWRVWLGVRAMECRVCECGFKSESRCENINLVLPFPPLFIIIYFI